MSLKRKDVQEILENAGVEGEALETALNKIIKGNIESIAALKEEKDGYKEELASVQKELDELKAHGSVDDVREQFKQLKKEFDEYKSDVEKTKLNGLKEKLFREILKNSSIDPRAHDLIAKTTNLDSLKLNKEQTAFENASDIKADIEKEHAKFKVELREKGANVDTPPKPTGSVVKSREEIVKIKDPVERKAAWAELIQNNK